MIISVKKIAMQLHIDLPDLITRPVGRRMYKAAMRKIANAMDGETVLCDFSGVEVIDPSFVDEFVVKLVRSSQDGEKPFYIRLKNISRMVEDNIRSVFQSYGEFTKKKFSIITDDLTMDNRHVIGIISEMERDIVEIMRINGCMSTKAIADYLQIESEKTGDLLNDMCQHRLIKRDHSRFRGV